MGGEREEGGREKEKGDEENGKYKITTRNEEDKNIKEWGDEQGTNINT